MTKRDCIPLSTPCSGSVPGKLGLVIGLLSKAHSIQKVRHVFGFYLTLF